MKKVRIANAGGFWGDWLEAPKRQLLGGPIHYLTLDYLAELTMSMLARQKKVNPERGYVYDFVRLCDELLPEIVSRGVKVVTNAGGVNGEACCKALQEVARKHGLQEKVKIALVSGDNLSDRIAQHTTSPLTHLETGESFERIRGVVQSANAYIGSDGIVEALNQGATIVVCGRVFDAGLVLGPLRHEFGWTDWDRLAAGVVVGHILECGAQATGGNCSAHWDQVPLPEEIGFPLAEVAENGEALITKHPNTGGEVTLQTVSEQLLYEIGDPKNYITPDVVADFTSVTLHQSGTNEVRVSSVKGAPPPETLKLSVSYPAGFRGEGTLLFSWPDAVRKAKQAEKVIRHRIRHLPFDEIVTEFIGWNSCHGSKTNVDESMVPEVLLRMAVRGTDKRAVERFIRELPPLVLSGPPGISGYAGDRGGAQEIFAYWPTLIPRSEVKIEVKLWT